MKTLIIKTLLKKELTDIFRDTKTIIIMIIVPTVLYPLIFMGSLLLTSSMMKESTVKTYKVAISAESEDYDTVAGLLDDALKKHEYHFEKSKLEEGEDYEKLLRDSVYDGIVEIKSSDKDYPDFNVYTLTSSNKSSTCKGMLKQVFKDYSDEIVKNRIKSEVSDYDELIKEPFAVDMKDFSSKEETTGMLIGYIMPFMMIISVLMGAFTVAIDVSVGEKERGTLETLITLPISNLEMMVSKFLAVSIFALFSVAINLLSFAAMGIYVLNSVKLSSNILGGFKFTQFIPSIILMIFLIVLFAFFVSALCLCVDFTAQSVKEANNYTTPLMLILMTGAGMSVLPGVKLNFLYALVPILNVSLLIKDLFMLKFDLYLIATVFSATILHTLFAVFVMTKVFSSENILFGEGIKSVKIFEKRANMKEKQIPGVGDIVFMFALVLLISNFAGGYVLLKFGFIGFFVSQFIIFLVPVLYSWYIKVDFVNLYSLKAPGIREMIGTVFFVIGSYIFNTVLVSILIKYFPVLAADNSSMTEVVESGGFAASLFVVGFMPAIAEETAFRGFLYGTLKNKKLPTAAVLILTAILFAAFHMNLLQFIYVTFMGLLMSYIIYNSKSIFTTALFHLINNSFSVILQFKADMFSNIKLFSDAEFGVKDSLIYVAIAAAFLIVGFVISDNKFGPFAKLGARKRKDV